MGFALQNIPCINGVCISVAEDIDPSWSSALRWVYVVNYHRRYVLLELDVCSGII